LYEYQCGRCGRFEVIQKFSDAALTTCPTCGQEVQKLLSAPAIQFKGTGWYITDYARKSSGTGAGKDGGSKDGGGKTDAGKGGDKAAAADGGGAKDSGKEKSGTASGGSSSGSAGGTSSPKSGSS
jgi:putative FmdB family regulatory protein